MRMPGEQTGKVEQGEKGAGMARQCRGMRCVLGFLCSKSDSFLSLRIYSAAFRYQ